MECQIPKNPGLIEMPEDKNDYRYGAIFSVEEAIPRKFKRDLPIGLNVPCQGQVPLCVSACFTFINQYKSYVNDKNNLNLSFRKVHSATGPYGRGRYLREVAKYLQSNGQPQDKYCPDNVTLSSADFMNTNLSSEGIEDSLRRKIGPYSFVNDGNINELCSAIIKEPIAGSLGGTNEDWRKPFHEIVKQTAAPNWYHCFSFWDYNLDEGWYGIYNWWNDGYRRISIDYKLTGSISFEDLPDGDNKIMLKAVKAIGEIDIYVIVGNNKHLIPDSDTQHYYLGTLGILNPVIEITKEELNGYTEGEKIPSIKLMRAIEPIAKDIFLKNEDSLT
jgi:hypothetical protein